MTQGSQSFACCLELLESENLIQNPENPAFEYSFLKDEIKSEMQQLVLYSESML